MGKVIRQDDRVLRQDDRILMQKGIGNGLKFDGVNDQALSNVSYPFDRTLYYTVEALFKYDGTGASNDSSGARVFYSSGVNSRALGFFINNFGDIRSYLSSSPFQIFSNRDFSLGDWVHYVGTYAPSGPSNTEHIMYLNGVQDNQINATSPSNGSGGDLGLGRGPDGRSPNITYHRFRFYVSSTAVAGQSDVEQMIVGQYPSSINSDLVVDLDFNQTKGDRHYSKVGSVYVDLNNFGSLTDYANPNKAWLNPEGGVAR